MWRLIGVLAVAALAWLGLAYGGWIDQRPVQRVLFVGHSRTYANELPRMVAQIAESGGSPVRLEVGMQAGPGATLKDHWQSPQSRRALQGEAWDHVVIQPNIVWRDDDDSSEFMTYGKLFVTEAERLSEASVVIDWPMRERFYAARGWNRAGHTAKTEAANRRLARASGAEIIDAAGVWEAVSAQYLPFSRYKDDDHPSVAGTYLVALVIADQVADADLATVDYTPPGMSEDHAALLRQRVRAAVDRLE